MKYQSVPLPEDLSKAENKIDSSDNKIHVNNFDNDYFIVWDNRFNINNDDDSTHFNDENNLKTRVMMN